MHTRLKTIFTLFTIADFLGDYGFDGVDLEFSYSGIAKNDFNDFVQELSDALHPEGYIVTAALSGSKTELA